MPTKKRATKKNPAKRQRAASGGGRRRTAKRQRAASGVARRRANPATYQVWDAVTERAVFTASKAETTKVAKLYNKETGSKRYAVRPKKSGGGVGGFLKGLFKKKNPRRRATVKRPRRAAVKRAANPKKQVKANSWFAINGTKARFRRANGRVVLEVK